MTRRWSLAVCVVAVSAVAAVFLSRSLVERESSPIDRSDADARSAVSQFGSPRKCDPAKVLDLPAELPRTAEGLKAEAIEACQRLVADLPDRPEAHAVLALTYKRFGRTADAVDCWEESLKVAPEFAPAYLGIASVAADKAEDEKAIALLRKAAKANRNLPGVHNLLCELLLREGRVEEALAVALEHRDLFPESHEAHFWLGQAYLQSEQLDQARSSHEEAIRLAPDFTHSYYSLAQVCLRLGDRESAQRYRQRFLALKEGDMQNERETNKTYRDLTAQRAAAANAHLCAGDVQAKHGSVEKAEAHWLRGAAIAPDDLDCRKALLLLYERQERPVDVQRVICELIALRPEDVGYRLQAATTYVDLGQLDKAEREYQKAIELAPESATAYAGLARIHLRIGRNISDAVDLAAKAAEREPSCENYVLLSAARSELGDTAGAIAAVQKAMRLDPDNEVPRQIYATLRRTQK